MPGKGEAGPGELAVVVGEQRPWLLRTGDLVEETGVEVLARRVQRADLGPGKLGRQRGPACVPLWGEAITCAHSTLCPGAACLTALCSGRGERPVFERQVCTHHRSEKVRLEEAPEKHSLSQRRSANWARFPPDTAFAGSQR